MEQLHIKVSKKKKHPGRSMTRWLALSSSSTSTARRTHLPAQSARSASRSTMNAASKLPERRWIERCVDESFNQLTAGKHHIVVVKPRGSIEKEINSAVVEHCSPHLHPAKRSMRIYSK